MSLFSHTHRWSRVWFDRERGHYQTCVECGAEIEYDWMNMRQGELISQLGMLECKNSSSVSKIEHELCDFA